MSDLISREHMKSLGATCIASRSKDGTLFPIVAIDELPPAQPDVHDTDVGDLISRQAAIDALDKRFDSVPMEQTTEILMLRKDLRELPSSQPRKGKWAGQITEDFCKDIDEQPTIEPQKWIPVSERLPEEGTEVLGTDDYGCIRHVVKDKCGLYEFATYEEMMHINIVAWQSLPDPYKGEEE